MALRFAQNPALAALLLVGFLSRALIPVGFMPGPGGLVICDGFIHAPGAKATDTRQHDMSAMEMADMDMAGMDMPGMDPHHTGPSKGGGSPEHEHSSICPFAAAATTMASSHAAVSIVVVPAVVRQVDIPSLPFVPRDTIVPTRLPRGPPSLA